MAATTSFVPVDQVIATAHSLLEGADTIDRAYFKEWVYLGLTELGPNTAWYSEATLYPVEFSLRKPANLYSTIDLALYNVNGGEFKYVLRGKGTRIHASDNGVINDGIYAPSLHAPVDLSEDAYYFHLGTNGNGVSYAIIKYWQFPVDEQGDLLVPESDVFPLALFCRYCYYMRKDDKTGMAMAKNSWIAARNEARSAHNTPTMLEGTEIARSWNSMIQKLRFRTF